MYVDTDILAGCGYRVREHHHTYQWQSAVRCAAHDPQSREISEHTNLLTQPNQTVCCCMLKSLISPQHDAHC